MTELTILQTEFLNRLHHDFPDRWFSLELLGGRRRDKERMVNALVKKGYMEKRSDNLFTSYKIIKQMLNG